MKTKTKNKNKKAQGMGINIVIMMAMAMIGFLLVVTFLFRGFSGTSETVATTSEETGEAVEEAGLINRLRSAAGMKINDWKCEVTADTRADVADEDKYDVGEDCPGEGPNAVPSSYSPPYMSASACQSATDCTGYTSEPTGVTCGCVQQT